MLYGSNNLYTEDEQLEESEDDDDDGDGVLDFKTPGALDLLLKPTYRCCPRLKYVISLRCVTILKCSLEQL